MRFILHSQITAESVRSSLGLPEYSYHFVMKGFRPAFERLGQVEVVVDPQREVDEIYRNAVAAGEVHASVRRLEVDRGSAAVQPSFEPAPRRFPGRFDRQAAGVIDMEGQVLHFGGVIANFFEIVFGDAAAPDRAR